MAWTDTLQQASFRGVAFDVLATSDPEQRAFAQHERPYQSGAELEDLGLRPRRIQLRAVVFGADYEAQLQQLLAALRAPGTGELVHPVFGSLTVLATEWSVDHEAEARDSATLQLAFVESATRQPAPFSQAAPQAASDRVEARTADAREQSAAHIASLITRIMGGPLPRVVEINSAFNKAKAAVSTLLDTTGVRVLLADLDPLLYPRSALVDLLAIVDGAFTGLPFGGLNLAAQAAATGASPNMAQALADHNRVASALDATALAIRPDSAQAQDIEVCAALTAHVRILAAAAQARAAGLLLTAELDLLALTRRDIERLAGLTRTALQAAMDSARTGLGRERGAAAAGSLAAAAAEVQAAAVAVIQLRPPVITRSAPVGGHPRLIAHNLYGDHTRAAELVRLNGWARRPLIDRGEEIQAYAR